MGALPENLPCGHGNNINEAPGSSFIRDMKILWVQTLLEKLMQVKCETQLDARTVIDLIQSRLDKSLSEKLNFHQKSWVSDTFTRGFVAD